MILDSDRQRDPLFNKVHHTLEIICILGSHCGEFRVMAQRGFPVGLSCQLFAFLMQPASLPPVVSLPQYHSSYVNT